MCSTGEPAAGAGDSAPAHAGGAPAAEAHGGAHGPRPSLRHHLERPRLPSRIIHAFSAPTFSALPVITLLGVYGNLFYERLGADLTYMSFFIALARSLDVITDPLMSYWTDSFKSPHGRRRPFLATGCWLYALALTLLLSPPHLDSLGLSFWFGFFYTGFFLCNTFTNIPYDALGPELTDHYHDRSKLFFVSGLYDGLGALIAMLLPVTLGALLYGDYQCYEPLERCYSESGIGLSCAPDINTERYTMYNIDTLQRNLTQASYNSTFCNTRDRDDDDQYYEGLINFCDCLTSCDATCSLEVNRNVFIIVGLFFSTYYVATMLNCVYRVREKVQDDPTAVGEPHPLVPSLLNTFRNRAFIVLLPAWVCDAVTNALIASMITYFIRYVVQPEYQNGEEGSIDCNEGVPISGDESSSWRCDSQSVIGMVVIALLCSAFMSTPIWLWLARRLGKRKAWLMWSCSMALTNISFMFLGKGNVNGVIALAALNGIPFGAKFLADSVLADIIDYDEFLTGSRHEATYTMFKSFLPKICAIPASALPLAMLDVVGHVAPEEGKIMPQDGAVYTFVQIVSVIVPTVISLIGFILKMRFPIKTRAQLDMITLGIAQHKAGHVAPDPITGIPVGLLKVSCKKQRETMHLLDNFPGPSMLERMEADQPRELARIVSHSRRQVFLWALGAVLSLTASILTFPLLDNDDWSLLPVICIITFGLALTIFIFSSLRMKSAEALRVAPPSQALVRQLLQHRRIMKRVQNQAPKIMPEEGPANDELVLSHRQHSPHGAARSFEPPGYVGGRGAQVGVDPKPAAAEEAAGGSLARTVPIDSSPPQTPVRRGAAGGDDDSVGSVEDEARGLLSSGNDGHLPLGAIDSPSTAASRRALVSEASPLSPPALSLEPEAGGEGEEEKER